MSNLTKETFLKKNEIVGIIMYNRVLTELKKDILYNDIQILNMKHLLYYLSVFDINLVDNYQTKEIISKIRVNPSNIELGDLSWESFIVANDSTYWRPYQIVSQQTEPSTITVECCQTLSTDNNIIYSEYVPTMIKKSFTIRKSGEQEIKMLLRLPYYTLDKGTNNALYCNGNKCTVSKIFHGTGYIFPDDAENAPYNYYGNWFTLGINNNEKGGESTIYMSNQDTGAGYLYEYEIKKLIKVLYFKENEQIDYLFAHMMYFETSIGIVDNANIKAYLKLDDSTNYIIPTNNDTINSFIFKDTYTIRDPIEGIEKYNYTIKKNLLNTSLPEPPFTNGYWSVIKAESFGDGDKGLAGKICNYSNSNDQTVPLRLNIKGWILHNFFFLMSCNPQEILRNLGVYIKLKPSLISGNPTINESFDRIIELYKNVLLGDGIVLENILYENYIFVPKNKYEIFRKKLKTLSEEFKKNTELKPLYDDYIKKILDIFAASDEAKRLELHKKIITPDRFLIGGNYYQKYLKYKSKYLKLKTNNF
jgi:hypothetical protein